MFDSGLFSGIATPVILDRYRAAKHKNRKLKKSRKNVQIIFYMDSSRFPARVRTKRIYH